MSEIVVLPVCPFPNIFWWQNALRAESVFLPAAEPFEKMTFRNCYIIAAAEGPLSLSIPLQGGRNRRTAMDSVCTDLNDSWQKRHWRGIFSAYNRSPFFEHYAHFFEPLFMERAERLAVFNTASIKAVSKALRMDINFTESLGEGSVADLSKQFKRAGYEQQLSNTKPYMQVFQRNGFLPNLSILDLLFCEGPNAINYLKTS